MEDLRRNILDNKFRRIEKWNKFKKNIKKNWFLILIFMFIIFIIIFPSIIGNIFGMWFNKLATSFLNNLTF